MLGKRDRDGEVLASSVGELDPAAVGTILTRVLPVARVAPRAGRGRARVLPLMPVPVPARARRSAAAARTTARPSFPAGALVGGGVGCHGIMYFEARHQGMKSLPPTPMGAEGVPWIGLSPFVDEPHLIQNIGDGTLSHSGHPRHPGQRRGGRRTSRSRSSTTPRSP